MQTFHRRGCSTRWKSCSCPGMRPKRSKSLARMDFSHGVLPLLDVILEQPLGQRFIELALANTDERIREDGRGVSPGFLLRHAPLARSSRNMDRAQGRRRTADTGAFHRDGRSARPAGETDRHSAKVRSDDEGNLEPPAALRAACRPATLPPAGTSTLSSGVGIPFDLRCRSGELEDELATLADWWDRFANASNAERESMLRPDEAPKKRSRSRGREPQASAATAVKTQTPVRPPMSAAGPGARRSPISDWAATSPTRAGNSRAPLPSRGCPGPRRERLVALPYGTHRWREASTRLSQRGGRARHIAHRGRTAASHCKRDERRAHRRATPKRNAPRTLDIDLLLYGQRRGVRGLTVPHHAGICAHSF